MNNFFLYLVVIMSWGTTWFAIRCQLGSVDIEASVFYRFALASLCLYLWSVWQKRRINFTLRDHMLIALQGALLFSAQYFFMYYAAHFIPSGLNCLVNSTIIFMNIINAYVFFRATVNILVIIGGILGFCGILLIFMPSLAISPLIIKGCIASFLGTLIASFGNMLSYYNQKCGRNVPDTNMLGMFYGSVCSLIYLFVRQKSLVIDFSFSYLASLFYLALVGSILAFGCYLTLLGRVGSQRAAYCMLMTPIIALTISTFVENYKWHFQAIIGALLVILGNIIILFLPHNINLRNLTNKLNNKNH